MRLLTVDTWKAVVRAVSLAVVATAAVLAIGWFNLLVVCAVVAVWYGLFKLLVWAWL